MSMQYTTNTDIFFSVQRTYQTGKKSLCKPMVDKITEVSTRLIKQGWI